MPQVLLGEYEGQEGIPSIPEKTATFVSPSTINRPFRLFSSSIIAYFTDKSTGSL